MKQTSSAMVRHANDRRKLFEPRTIHSSAERSFQYIMPQDYIINRQWKLKTVKDINQFRKRLKTYLFGEPYDMN